MVEGDQAERHGAAVRLFYFDEAPIDTLLQIAAKPVADGDLVSKTARDKFVQLDWVARCHGWNVITAAGQKAIEALALRRLDIGAGVALRIDRSPAGEQARSRT